MKVTGLNIHPLKSGRAIASDFGVHASRDGLAGDRRFMLVDPGWKIHHPARTAGCWRTWKQRHVGGGVHLEMGTRAVSVLRASIRPGRLDVSGLG